MASRQNFYLGICIRFRPLLRLFFDEFKQISGLTVQSLTDSAHSFKADALHFAGLEIRKVDVGHAELLRQLVQGHFPVGQHTVQPYDDLSHSSSLRDQVVVFLKSLPVDEDLRNDANNGRQCDQQEVLEVERS